MKLSFDKMRKQSFDLDSASTAVPSPELMASSPPAASQLDFGEFELSGLDDCPDFELSESYLPVYDLDAIGFGGFEDPRFQPEGGDAEPVSMMSGPSSFLEEALLQRPPGIVTPPETHQAPPQMSPNLWPSPPQRSVPRHAKMTPQQEQIWRQQEVQQQLLVMWYWQEMQMGRAPMLGSLIPAAHAETGEQAIATAPRPTYAGDQPLKISIGAAPDNGILLEPALGWPEEYWAEQEAKDAERAKNAPKRRICGGRSRSPTPKFLIQEAPLLPDNRTRGRSVTSRVVTAAASCRHCGRTCACCSGSNRLA